MYRRTHQSFTLMTKLTCMILSLLLIVCAVPTMPVWAEDVSTAVQAGAVSETTATSNPEVEPAAPTTGSAILSAEGVLSTDAIPTTVTEVTSLREESIKHFKLPDGTYQAVIYADAVHRMDSSGQWQNIDNRLYLSQDSKSNTEAYRTTDGRTSFAKSYTANQEIFSLTENGYAVSVSMISNQLTLEPIVGGELVTQAVGTTAAAPAASTVTVTNAPAKANPRATEWASIEAALESVGGDNGSIVYTNVAPHTDLEYVLQGNDVKENIIVKATSLSYVYRFRLELTGLTATLTDSGTVSLRDTDGIEQLVIPVPYMYDATGATSYAVTYGLATNTDGSYTLTVTADPTWVNDADRVFPVTIDPSISVSRDSVTDTYVSNEASSLPHGSSDTLVVDDARKAYWKTSSLPVLPGSRYITRAEIVLRQKTFSDGYVGVYQVTSSWDENLTWSDTIAETPQGQTQSSPIDYEVISEQYAENDNYFAWDITSLVQSWYDGGENHGVCFQIVEGTSSNDSSRFYSSRSNPAAYRPQFTVSYVTMLGTESYWTYSSHSVGLAGTGHVNLATGNLVFSKSLLSTTDSLMPYTASLTYNSALAGKIYQYPNAQSGNDTRMAPRGFKMNMQETVIKKSYYDETGVLSYYYIWADGDGTEHCFMPVDGSTVYRDEDGLMMTLTTDNIGVTITDSSYNQRSFCTMTSTPDGVEEAYWLYSICDKNGNSVKFLRYTDNYRQDSVRLCPVDQGLIAQFNIYYNDYNVPYLFWDQISNEAVLLRYSGTPTATTTKPNSGNVLRQVIYARGNASTLLQNWLDFYNDPSVMTNITVDATMYYSYNSSGQLTRVEDGLSGYAVEYTLSSEGKVTAIQEYGSSTVAGQKMQIEYYTGYTVVRSSGTDDVINNSDDILTRYVFDDCGRVVTSYSYDAANTAIYGVTSGTYESGNEMASNKLTAVSVTSGNRSANYIVNGNFEASKTTLVDWYVSSTADVTARVSGVTSVKGSVSASLDVNAGQTTWICQYVSLYAGEYTLSLDLDTVSVSDAIVRISVESLSDTSRVFTKDLSVNQNGASMDYSFDFLTFTAEPTVSTKEQFRVKISVIGGSNASAADGSIDIDNIMLAYSSGVQAYNMLQNGGFENSHYYENGSQASSPSDYWVLSSDSGISASRYFGLLDELRGRVMGLRGGLAQEARVEQVVYEILNPSGNSSYYTPDPLVFTISGFARATSVMSGSQSKFALRVDASYYISETMDPDVVTQYYEFSGDMTEWQYVSGTFVVPENKNLIKITVSCEYSGNTGYAYFDDISFVLEEDNTASYTEYDALGRVSLTVSGHSVTRYFYNTPDSLVDHDLGDVSEVITRTGRARYSYDDNHNLTTEYHYSRPSGYFPYNADRGTLVEAIWEYEDFDKAIERSYNAYGLLTYCYIGDTIVSTETDYTYNLTPGSKIFGALTKTVDSTGSSVEYHYNETNGWLLAEINQDGTGTCYTYDAIGNLTMVLPAKYVSANNPWDPVEDSAEVDYTYNIKNQLTRIDTETAYYTFTYDAYGNITAVGYGIYSLTTRAYNANNGKLASVSYSNGAMLIYVYDHLNRVTKLIYSDTLNTSNPPIMYEYEYDSNGNLSKFIDPASGTTTVYRYGEDGRVLGYVVYDTTELVNLSSGHYDYDDQSRLQSVSYIQDYPYGTSQYGSVYRGMGYSYNNDNSIQSYTVHVNGDSTYVVTPTYDALDRLTSKNTDVRAGDQSVTYAVNYTYGDNNLPNRYETQVGSNAEKAYAITYDDALRITSISGGNQHCQYEYDDLGQLIRETNSAANATYVYTYDDGGNILSKITYAYTTGDLTGMTPKATITYTYGNTGTGDRLMTYRGYGVTHDSVGNMLSYHNGAFVTNFTWRKGRELASTSALGRTVTYTYNDQGIRTSKTVDGVVHTYTLDGSRILSEEYGGKLYLYFYDESGAIMGFHYRDNTYAKDVFDTYFYEKTYLGDVIGIYDENGTRLAWYMYDAWGNVVHSNCATGYTDLMNANPFRYRGYYYDTDTGLYYLNSRYYNPILGRFINADAVEVVTATPSALTDKNLYAYCDNNPIMRVDADGRFWKKIKKWLQKCETAFFNAIELEAGVGYGIGASGTVGVASYEAEAYSDILTLRLDDSQMFIDNTGSAGITAMGFGINGSYHHDYVDRPNSCGEHTTVSNPFSVATCDSAEKNPFGVSFPIVGNISMSSDYVISVSVSSHKIIGGHASAGFNLSQFMREMGW